MRTFFESLAVAFSMYSRVPMPRVEWNEKNMRYALAFFPLVGAAVGALLYALWRVSVLYPAALGPVLFAALAAALPVLVTGGIHLDGFCDTCDALGSHREREEKLRILKDPHVGAFGLIYTVLLLLLQFGAFTQVKAHPALLGVVLLSYPASRCLGGLAVLFFPCGRREGLAGVFSGAAARRGAGAALFAELTVSLGLMALLAGPWMFAAAAAMAVWLFVFYRISVRQFGGVTGDLAGFFLTVCETLLLLLAAVLPAVF